MTDRVIYEIDGKRLYGELLSQEEIVALGLASCPTEEPCTGDRLCIDGYYYRCVLNAAGHGCAWLRTSEVC